MVKKALSLVLLSLLFFPSSGQDARNRWVDSVFNTLSRDQKIGQLFMVPVSAYAPESEIDELTDLVKRGDIGGYYITTGGPISHVRLLNKLQDIAKIPLLVGISAEWGVSQTLDSTMGFQKPLMAASWKNDSLFTVWAREISSQMKTLGFNLNFAPNADSEIFPGDYLRYFGNEEHTVAKRTVAFSKILQSEGILTVAKHLPRRLMAEAPLRDSTLVMSLAKIDTAGSFAFRQLIQNKVNGILTNYLHFSMQNEKGIIPAALSQIFISDILKKRLNFQGLVFADVTNFKKTTVKTEAGDAELLAFETGNDILLSPIDIKAATKKITRRMRKDKLLQAQLDVTVRKILIAKYDAGLNHVKVIDTYNLAARLYTIESAILKRKLAEASTTIIKNEHDFLPIRSLEGKSFLSISIGREAENEFSRYLQKYVHFETAAVTSLQDTTLIPINKKDVIVISVFPYANALENQLYPWIERLSLTHRVVIVHFGNPSKTESYKNSLSILAGYTDQDEMTMVIPQMIFGALPASGMLPVKFKERVVYPLATVTTDRMSYTLPELAGMDSKTLDKIRAIMKETIDIGAAPGCQVLVIRNGKVVFEESVGTLTYESKTPVDDNTIYDLASLTKVTATLQTTMFMYEKGLIDINKKASVYLPVLKHSNKKDITLIDMLTHQSGLIPFIPLWPLTVKDSVFMPLYYSSIRDAQHPLQISKDLYAVNAIRDSVWSWIVHSKMQDKIPRTQYPYRYSDLGFMMLKEIAEKVLNQPLDEFLHQNLYEPLGAYTTGFNPLDRFSEKRIAPTEVDKIYRRSTVVGTVHDERAAMMGGVSGHAGLFSTANDLAKVGQMLLQGGSYGGTVFFKPETIRYFTAKQFMDSRRGLGWDRPILNDWSSPTAWQASQRTFGHTGFTGTCMWIDPEFNLVYIFLSNRVYPDRNNKLLNANIRPRIQEVVYQSIFNYCSNKN